MKSKEIIILVCAALFIMSAGCRHKNNTVSDYFKNVEIQCEDSQRENIINALNDMLTLSVEELKRKRYQDYQGNKDQWNLITLINRHFVTDGVKGLGDFYRYIKTDEAQNEVRRLLKGFENRETSAK